MALTEETLQALAEMRAAVGRLVDGQTSDIIAAWLHTLQEVRQELEQLAISEVDRRRLLEQSQRIVAERIHQVVEETNTRLTAQARLMVDNALTWQEALIGTQLPSAASGLILRPARAAIDAIVNRTVQQITVRHYYLSVEATKAVQRNLRIGITAGLNPRETAARVVQAVEGEFNGGMTRALTIARTEMLDAHRAASHATRKANSDVLAGWVWIAKLDARTCPSCIAQHGRLHDFDEPGPNDHHNGRCDALPKTRSWAELGFTGVGEPPGVDIETGEDWFNQLPPSRQQEILGPARYNAWQAGNYPIDAWSERRVSEGWRDAWHTTPAPREPEHGWKWPVPDGPPNPAQAAHFLARQNRIPFDFAGETLKPREVVFAEHMHELGETIRWIPTPPAVPGRGLPPASDFEWRGKKYELKSPKPDADAITARIRKAVDKSHKWGPEYRKQRFVIHLPSGASPELLDALSTYNLTASGLDTDLSIKELWVLTDQLRRIELKR